MSGQIGMEDVDGGIGLFVHIYQRFGVHAE